MNNRRELIRLLHGELDEVTAAALNKRLRTDDALRREWEHLRRLWKKLDCPRSPEVPRGFSRRVTAIAIAEEQTLNLRYAPIWARTAALVSLVAGLSLGALIVDPHALPVADTQLDSESNWLEGGDLASQYFSLIDSSDGGEILED